MKIVLITFLVAVVAIANSKHTFLGTNVLRPMVYHHQAQYSSKAFKKRVENQFFQLPTLPSQAGRVIQGILAYDLKNSEASANVTQGGVGFSFVNIRMKSERGRGINYDIYIYA